MTMGLNEILLAVFITVSVCSIIAFLIYRSLHAKLLKVSVESLERINALKQEHFSNIRDLTEDKELELRESYNRGSSDAIRNMGFSVQVTPFKEESDLSNLIKNKRSIKVGYKYQLFVNDIPCFEPHVTIVDEIATDNINQANIDRILGLLETTMGTLQGMTMAGLPLKVVSSGKMLLSLFTEFNKKPQ